MLGVSGRNARNAAVNRPSALRLRRPVSAIRHYGLLANGSRKANLALVREFLDAPAVAARPADGGDLRIQQPTFVCWHCGQAMTILQTFTRGHGPAIRAPPSGQPR